MCWNNGWGGNGCLWIILILILICCCGCGTGGYGNRVEISHGDGTSTLYGHMLTITVSVGQTVNQGDIIGYVGCTGYSTGTHLHFEIKQDGVQVDPMPYL